MLPQKYVVAALNNIPEQTVYGDCVINSLGRMIFLMGNKLKKDYDSLVNSAIANIDINPNFGTIYQKQLKNQLINDDFAVNMTTLMFGV